jgi:SAM-dependent methyltransferase
MDTVARRPLPARAKDWFMWRVGPGLSKVGERLGLNWLVYNPLLYYSFNELAVRNAPGVIGAISERFPQAQSYIDVGAGGGAFAAEAGRLGKRVVACEYSPHGRKYARRHGVDVHEFDLSRPVPTDIPGRFDLAYCFEIAEHLTPEMGISLVEFLVAKGRVIVFTAAQPGQEGTGHINEQPREYWIERFESRGARYDADGSADLSKAFAAAKVSSWFEQNVSVFHTSGD